MLQKGKIFQKEINSSFIKTKKQYRVQRKSLNKLTLKLTTTSEKKRYKGIKKKPKNRCKGETCCRFKISSKGAIPQHFYMPITQAAKEPDFGLAPLKKRCRESNPKLAPLKKRCREPNLGPAPLKKRCRQPEVDRPPRNHACGIADGADGGKPFF